MKELVLILACLYTIVLTNDLSNGMKENDFD